MHITDPADWGTRNHRNSSKSVVGRKTVIGLTGDLKWMKRVLLFVLMPPFLMGSSRYALLYLCPITSTVRVYQCSRHSQNMRPYGKGRPVCNQISGVAVQFRTESVLGEISCARSGSSPLYTFQQLSSPADECREVKECPWLYILSHDDAPSEMFSTCCICTCLFSRKSKKEAL
jgi:hypothetical protein